MQWFVTAVLIAISLSMSGLAQAQRPGNSPALPPQFQPPLDPNDPGAIMGGTVIDGPVLPVLGDTPWPAGSINVNGYMHPISSM